MYIVPLMASNGYQAFRGSRGAGSVIVSLVSLSTNMTTDSPKKVMVTQPLVNLFLYLTNVVFLFFLKIKTTIESTRSIVKFSDLVITASKNLYCGSVLYETRNIHHYLVFATQKNCFLVSYKEQLIMIVVSSYLPQTGEVLH